MRPSVLLAALAACLLLAGCGGGGGGDDRAAYVEAINGIQATVAQRLEQLGEDVTATSTPTQDRRTLLDYETTVRDAVTRLRALHAPEGFDDLQERLAGDLGAYGTAVARARSDLARATTPKAALDVRTRLTASARDVQRRLTATIAALNERLSG